MTRTEVEDELLFQVRASGLSAPQQQGKIIPGRKFAFDFVWPDHKLAVEVQGGIWLPAGGHNTGTGIERDCEKLNLAVLAGWRVLHVTSGMVRSGQALAYIEEALR